MKTLTSDLINDISEGDEFEGSIPEGYHAIKGVHATTGRKGYILMPDELSIEEWEAQQDDPEHIKERQEEKAKVALGMEERERKSNSKGQRAHKTPIGCNVANKDANVDGKVATDITESAPTEASIRADEKAFDELFPDLEND